MVIDVLQSQRSVIRVSTYDDPTCDKIKQGSLSVLEGEPLQWTISDTSTTSATITIDFIDTISFENLKFNFSIPTNVQCYYSYDGYSWNEFNYFIYNITSYDLSNFNGSEDERRVMMSYAGKIIKMDFVPMSAMTANGMTVPAHVHRHYTVYDPIVGKAVAVSNNDYQILTQYLATSFQSGSNVTSQYVFRVVDTAAGVDKCIYNDLKIQHIQLKVSNFDTTGAWKDSDDPVPTPFILNQLQILASVDINIHDTYLSAFAGTMYKQKYFEEYPFITSIANSFFEMLESSDKAIRKNPKDITIDFNINESASKIELSITPPLQLGEFFNPAFAWTIGPAGATKRFVYTSIPSDGNWTEINAYLASITDNRGVISKVTNLIVEFAVYTSQFKINKAITYDLTKPHVGAGWLV